MNPPKKTMWVSHACLCAIEAEQARRKWTDSQMARALRIARPHWSAARAGKRNLPFVAVCSAYALGVAASALLAMQDP